MIYYLLVLFLAMILVNSGVEHFLPYSDPKFTFDYNDPGYKTDYVGDVKLEDQDLKDWRMIKPTDPKRQKYLQFLSRLNDKFKESMPKTGVFRGTCDDTINEKIKQQVISDSFQELDKEISPDRRPYKREVSKKDKTKTLDCVGMSNELCETTNPYFYLIDSPYFPPPWILPTYKDIDYPKNTNLTCFNKNFSCCKSSLN
jgi:hypothetical protein